MNEISDDMLMAYADDELDAKDRTNVEAYLARSAEGTGRFAVFVATGRRLAALFDQPMREPVPQRLIDALQGAPRAPSEPSAEVIHIGRGRNTKRTPQRSNLWLVAACVTLLAAGVGAEFALHQHTRGAESPFGLAETSTGTPIAGKDLAAALDTVASGSVSTREIAGVHATIKPVFTFANIGGGFCRQYAIAGEGAVSFAGVACRMPAGQWQIQRHVAAAPERAKKDGHTYTAGGPELEALEAMVAKLISGDVLSGDAELAVMQSGWIAPKR